MQIVLENSYRIKVKVVEMVSNDEDEALMPLILNALGDQPLIQAEAVILSERVIEIPNVKIENKPLKSVGDALVVVASNLLENPAEACDVISENGYLLSRERLGTTITPPKHLHTLTIHETANELLVLLRKGSPTVVNRCVEITEDIAWLPRLQQALRNEENVVIYSQNQAINGILGLTNCIRKETNGEICKCVLIDDENAPPFELDGFSYQQQLAKGFAVNVLRNGEWGTYRHLLLEETMVGDVKHSLVAFETKGDLSSARWIEGPLNQSNGDGDEGLIEVV